MARNETILLGLNHLTNWGILTTDAALSITGWNHWLETNSGHAAADMVGRALLTAFPDLLTRQLDQAYRQALDGRVIVLSQRLHKYLIPMPPSADGVDLPHMQQNVRIAPLVEEGAVVGTLTVIEDVTERVAYTAELAARAREQAALAKLGELALAGADLAALFSEAMAVTADRLDVDYALVLERVDDCTLTLQAAVGLPAALTEHAPQDADVDSHLRYALGAAAPVVSEDLATETRFALPTFLRGHGVVSGMSVPVIGGDRPLGVVGVYTTCSRSFTTEHVHFLQSVANLLGMAMERKRLEVELQVKVGQLADADQRKDEFLAMLAHELRNPLAPIRNAVQLLRLKASPASEERYARDVIERQIKQLTRLVDDLLDVSRITRGKVKLESEPIQLATIVANAVEISRPLIDARKHDLAINLPPGPVVVNGDPARLAQVVANLLNNAAKYTEEGGRIHLSVERQGEQAVLRVRDTGLGIAPGMLLSIFDLFTQAQGSVSRSEGGLGIGLSLVRTLVDMHGGTVTAASDGLGRGSEFTVRLPLLKNGAFAGGAAEKPANPRRILGRRILVVDDNVDSGESLALLLRVIGHDVRTAHDGRAALEAARTDPPDIALLDIGLPGMDGLEVARSMRGELGLKDALLIALTGYGQDEDRRRSEEAGFDAHLVKPVDVDILQALLARSSATKPGGNP